MQPNMDPYVILKEPEAVRIWSTKQLPFEPERWEKRLKGEICESVRGLRRLSGKTLHAVYVSSSRARVDAENILFYNVGASCFSGLGLRGIRFEHAFKRPPPPPMKLDGQCLHYWHYEASEEHEGYMYWKAGLNMAT